MQCIKCGRELSEQAAFCKKCTDAMEKYPVKPGTVIQLPQRPAAASQKKSSRKKAIPAEELVIIQKRAIRWLYLSCALLFVMLCITVAALLHEPPKDAPRETYGQNFSTRDATTDD